MGHPWCPYYFPFKSLMCPIRCSKKEKLVIVILVKNYLCIFLQSLQNFFLMPFKSKLEKSMNFDKN